jgi:hypothetical protein
VAVSFQVQVDAAAPLGEPITNVAWVRDSFGRIYETRATVVVASP